MKAHSMHTRTVYASCLGLVSLFLLSSHAFAQTTISVPTTLQAVGGSGALGTGHAENESVNYAIDDNTTLTIISAAAQQAGSAGSGTAGNVYFVNTPVSVSYTIAPSAGAMFNNGSVIFQGNTSGNSFNNSGRAGGAFALTGGSEVTVNLTNAEFRDYRLYGSGGAIATGTGVFALNFINVSFLNNSGTAGGGSQTVYGGGIYMASTGTTSMIMNGGTFYKNFVMHVSSAASTVYGGAIYSASENILDLRNVVFEANLASVTASTRGTAYGGAINATNSDIKLNNVTFISNTASVTSQGSSATGYGGAIYVSAGTLGILNGGTFTSNVAYSQGATTATAYGGAIYSDGSILTMGTSSHAGDPTIVFQNNAIASGARSYAYGGAVYIGSNNKLFSLNDAKFSENKATAMANSTASGFGGGLYIGGGPVIIDQAVFSSNTASGSSALSAASAYGGAIYIDSGSITMKGVTMGTNSVMASAPGASGKSVALGGAVYLNSGTLTMIDSVLIGNTASGTGPSLTINGGAVYETGAGSRLYWTRVLAEGNSSQENGGALYMTTQASGSFNNVTFKNNTAGGAGGAVNLDKSGASIVIDTGTFIGNSSDGNGGALYMATGYNGTFIYNVFDSNTAGKNGAATAYGGAVYVSDTLGGVASGTFNAPVFKNNTVSGTSSSGNATAYGGALYMTSNASIKMSNVEFRNNSARAMSDSTRASAYGGAIYANTGNLLINNGTFSGNSVVGSGTGSIAYGGAVFAQNSVITFNDVMFSNNEATGTSSRGGAIYVNTSGLVNINVTSAGQNMIYAGNAAGTETIKDAAKGGFLWVGNGGTANFNIAAGKTLTIGNVANTQIDSIASESTSDVITVSDSGTLILNADSSSNKAKFQINAGSVWLGNADAALGGVITVAAGAVLGGEGAFNSINGSVTAQAGALIHVGSLGDTSGTQTLNFGGVGTDTRGIQMKNSSTLAGSGTLSGYIKLGISSDTITMDIDSGKTLAISANIDGGGSISKIGTGAVLLTGSSSGYNSVINVTAGSWMLSSDSVFTGGSGRLNISSGALLGGSGTIGTASTGNVSLATGATLLVGLAHNNASQLAPETFTISGTLKLAAGSIIKFDLFESNASDLLKVGSIVQTGTSTFDFNSAARSGRYTLIDFSESSSGFDITNILSQIGGANLTGGATAVYDITTDPTKLFLNLTLAGAANYSLIWNGHATTSWNSIGSNWTGVVTEFGTGDKVTFNDTAAEDKRAIIIDAAGVQASDMLVDTSGTYFFSGGAITTSTFDTTLANPTATLSKQGTGVLDLTGQGAGVRNNFMGGVEINSGALRISSTGQLGTTLDKLSFTGLAASPATGTLTIAGNSALTFDSASGTANRLVIADGNFGAISLETSSTLVFQNNDSSPLNGAAITIGNSASLDLTASGNSAIQFTSNNGRAGGAVYVDTDGTLRNVGTINFSNNKADAPWFPPADLIGGGGAIFNRGLVDLSNATFTGNKSEVGTNSSGGAIFNHTGTLTLTDVAFLANTATNGGFGGAIYTRNGQVTITRALFDGNSAGSAGAVNSIRGETLITSATFQNNKAIDTDGLGGAIYHGDGLNIGSTMTLVDVDFTRNSSAFFGGAVTNNYAGAVLTATNVRFSGNTALAGGGALQNCFEAVASFTNVLFVSNTANEGGAITNYNDNATLTLTDANFINNTAAGLGGAIHNRDATLNLNVTAGVTSTFAGNTANGIANSIHLLGDSTLAINIGPGATLDMQDQMSGYASAGKTIAISSTGAGLWKLGGTSAFTTDATPASRTTFAVSSGTLQLANAAAIQLAGTDSRFTLGANSAAAQLVLGNGNKIAATDGLITFGDKSTLAFASISTVGSAFALSGSTIFDNATLNLRLGSGNVADHIDHTGGIVGFVGTSTIAIDQWVKGVYTLLTSDNALGYTVATSSTVRFGTALTGRQQADLLATTGTSLVLSLYAINQDLTWTNFAASNLWMSSATNWVYGGSTNDSFVEGDSATFTDASAGANTIDVDTSGVKVAAMTVTGGTYTFNGGLITSTTDTTLTAASSTTQKLAISGDAHVTINNVTDFAHGVTLADGQITLGNDSALGVFSLDTTDIADSRGQLTVLGSGTLQTLANRALTNRVVVNDGSSLVIDNAPGSTLTFQNVNSGTTPGGAIYIGTGGTLRNNGAINFASNTSEASWDSPTAAGVGGALFNKGTVELSNATFTANKADVGIASSGGAIFNHTGTLALTDVAFLANTATNGGFGGAIYTRDGKVTVTRALFDGNIAGSAGAFNSIRGDTLITSATFQNNKAIDSDGLGGALYHGGLGAGGTMTLVDVDFTRNSSAFFGGAITNNYTGAVLTATNVRFSGNTALAGGGALQNCFEAVATFTNVLFVSNTANEGGAITNYNDNATLTLTDANFINNTAAGLGGAIKNADATLNLNVTAGVTSTFAGNTANGTANSIHLADNSTLVIDIGAGGTLDMQDAMSGDAANGNTVAISSTGAGLWKLGGTNAFTQAGTGKTTFTVQSGRLQLTTDARIDLGGADSTFSLANGAVLDMQIATGTAITTGSFVAATGAIINVNGFTGPGAITSFDGTADTHTLVVAGAAIARNYSISLSGTALSLIGATESTFLTTQESLADANKVQLTTGLAWNNTAANSAHGTFQIDTGTFTLGANLANNTTAGAGMNSWTGDTLKKTGTGTLVLTGTNTFTGTTRILDGTLINAGELASNVETALAATFQNTGTLNAALDNAGYTHNTGFVAGLVTTSGTFINDTASTIATLAQTAGVVTNNTGSILTATVTDGMLTNNSTIYGITQNSGTVINNSVMGVTTITAGTMANNAAANISVLNQSGGAVTNAGYIRRANLTTALLTNVGTIETLAQLSGTAINTGAVTGTANVTGGLFANNTGGVISGTLAITGGTFANTGGSITGATTINTAGTILFNSGTLAAAITNNGALEFANAAAHTQSAAIDGTGAISKTGAGDLTFAAVIATNSVDVQTGKLTVAPTGTLTTTGLLNIGATSTLGLTVGTGPSITAGSVNFNNTGKLDINGYSIAAGTAYPFVPDAARTVIHSTGGGIIGFSSTNVSVTGQASVDFLRVSASTTGDDLVIDTMLAWNMQDGTATGNMTLASGQTFTINAPLGGNFSTHAGWDGQSLTKLGAGTLILGGVNTYTGTTTISSGTLINNGVLASAVSADAGTALKNTGTINAGVTIATGAVATNTGRISAGSASVHNSGSFANSGEITDSIVNYGSLTNLAAGTLSNLVQYEGMTTNSGSIATTYAVAGTINTNGKIQSVNISSGTVANLANGLIGSVTNGSDGVFTNAAGGSVTRLINYGTAINAGTITGTASLIGSTFTNATTGVINVGYFQSGTYTNAGIITTATLSGADLINTGTVRDVNLQAGSIANTGAVTGTTTISSGNFSNNANGTLGTVEIVRGLLTQNGGSITGETTIGAEGTLFFNSGTFGALVNSGTLTYANAAAYTQSTAITGTGAIAKTGAGEVTLANAIAAGNVNVQTGKLTVATTGSLTATGTLNIANSATLGLAIGSGTSIIANTVAFNNTGKLDVTGYIFNNTGTYPTSSSGARTVIHSTGGGITGFNAANVTIAGQSNVDFLRVSAGVTGADLIVDTFLTWNLQDGTAHGTYNLAAGQIFTINAPLANNTSTHAGWDGQSLTKLGGGTLILGGANTYTGTTNVTAGVLELNNTGTTTNGAVNIASNALLRIVNAPAFTVANALTGSGTLSIALDAPTSAVSFTAASGTTFNGTVRLAQSTLALANTAATALRNASLELGAGNTTTVATGTQQVGNLALAGAKLIFTATVPADKAAAGIIETTNLALNSGTVQVTIPTTGIANPTTPGTNLFAQDDGTAITRLITATGAITGNVNNLTLVDQNNNSIGAATAHGVAITEGGDTVATGTYNYGLTATGGLNVSYKLTHITLATGKTLHLAPDAGATGANSSLSAAISGNGNLSIDATNAAVTLAAANTFSGTTTLVSGTLNAGANNALGAATNALALGNNTALNLGANTQTLGAITTGNASAINLSSGGTLATGSLALGENANVNLGTGALNVTAANALTTAASSTINLAGGALTVNGGAANGTLIGAGALNIASGNLVLNSTNTGLTAPTSIAANAAATMNNLAALGTGAINLAAASSALTVNNNATSGTFANAIAGSGSLTLAGSATTTIAHANTAFTGAANINGNVIAANTAALGTSTPITVGTAGALTYTANGTIANAIAGNGTLNLASGTTTLTGSNAVANINIVNNANVTTGNVNALGGTTTKLAINNAAVTLAQNNIALGDVALAGTGKLGFAPSVTAGVFKNATANSLTSTGTSTNLAFNTDISVGTSGTSDTLRVSTAPTGTFGLTINNTGGAPTSDSVTLNLLNASADSATYLLTGTTVQAGMRSYGVSVASGTAGLAVRIGANGALSSAGEMIVNMAGAMPLTWFAELDSVQKRMGDIRLDARGKPGMQVWMRTYAQRLDVNSEVTGTEFSETQNGADAGLDFGGVQSDGNAIYVGAFAGYGESNRKIDYVAGEGKTTSGNAGLYFTLTTPDGWYLDVTAKYNNFKNRFDTQLNNAPVNARYTTNAFGMSFEGGRHIALGNNWFVEAQAQAASTQLGGATYTTNNSSIGEVKVASGNASQVRAGVVVGRKIANAAGRIIQPYAKLHGAQQWASGGKITVGKDSWSPLVEGARVEGGVGVNWVPKVGWQFYFDYECAWAESYTKPYGLNAGVRYAW